MAKMYIARDGSRYFGDMQFGARETTPEEVVIFEAEQTALLAAQEAREVDKIATITDPYVDAVAALTRLQIIDHIDTTFPTLTVAQRKVLKAMALTCRFLINEKK